MDGRRLLIVITSPRQFLMAKLVGTQLEDSSHVQYAVLLGRCFWYISEWKEQARRLERPFEVIEIPRIETTSAGVFSPILRRFGAIRLYSFAARVPKLLAARATIGRYLRGRKFDASIAFTIVPEVNLLFAALHSSGTRTIVVQEGVWLEPSRQNKLSLATRIKQKVNHFTGIVGFPLQGGFAGCRDRHVDLYCVAGKATKQLLLKYRIRNERIAVTGMIDDHLAVVQRGTAKLALRPRSQTPSDVVHLLYIKQRIRSGSIVDHALMRTLIEFVKRRPKVHLTVKLHPNDTDTAETFSDCFRDLIEDDERIEIVRDADIVSLLEHSSVAITLYSGVAMQAIVRKIPLVVVDYFDVPSSLDFLALDYGCALLVRSEDELVPTLDAVSFDHAVRERIRAAQAAKTPELIAAHDGRTLSRIQAVAMNLLCCQNDQHLRTRH